MEFGFYKIWRWKEVMEASKAGEFGFWFITLYNREDEGGFVHNFWFVLYIYIYIYIYKRFFWDFYTFQSFFIFNFFNFFFFFESCMSMCDKLSRMACWLSEWTWRSCRKFGDSKIFIILRFYKFVQFDSFWCVCNACHRGRPIG